MTTLTVRELIIRLVNYDMDEPVYVGLGPRGMPDASVDVISLVEVASGPLNYGVYIIPKDHLLNVEE